MTEGTTVKLPQWLVGILIGILMSLLSLVYAAGQAIQRINEAERRLSNIETGVHQLWEEALHK